MGEKIGVHRQIDLDSARAGNTRSRAYNACGSAATVARDVTVRYLAAGHDELAAFAI